MVARDHLRQAGRAVRSTRQGAAVLDAVRASDAFKSAQEIHARLRDDGASVGLTTVYRHLQLLVDDGVVDALQGNEGETVYRYCRTDEHHHHLVCRGCGSTEEIEGAEVEEWAREIASRQGYTNVSHTLEVFGLCPRCSKRENDLRH